MLHSKFHENRNIHKKGSRNSGWRWALRLNLFFVVNYDPNFTYGYVFHFSTNNSLGGVHAQRKCYNITNLLTNKRTQIMTTEVISIEK